MKIVVLVVVGACTAGVADAAHSVSYGLNCKYGDVAHGTSFPLVVVRSGTSSLSVPISIACACEAHANSTCTSSSDSDSEPSSSLSTVTIATLLL